MSGNTPCSDYPGGDKASNAYRVCQQDKQGGRSPYVQEKNPVNDLDNIQE